MGKILNQIPAVDVVLTKKGRQKLASGEFNPIYWAVSDDEVDYGLYDPTATSGQEYLEIQRTLIFEASTHDDNLKYLCQTLSVPDLYYLPTLTITSGASGVTLDENNNKTTPKIVSLEPEMFNEATIPSELVDAFYDVEIPHELLSINNHTPRTISSSKTALYLIPANDISNTYGGRGVSFGLKTQTIPDNLWTVYGGSGTNREIICLIEVRGRNSGLSKFVTVTINES